MYLTKFHPLRMMILLGLLLSGFAAQAQVPVPPPFAPRLPGGNIKIKGDIVFVGNNILNRADANNPSQANNPLNTNDDNNSFNMEYIDIDGDPTTFSSSSANLQLTGSCYRIVYAGLYWASTYPYERSTNANAQWNGTPRLNDWNQVKFKLPGGTYSTLVADNAADPAGQEDAIIFDGYNANNIAQSFKDAPIICYKNVTGMLQGLANPNGTYTLANLRAAKGRRDGSSSAGWVMVVIYEDPNLPGKFISTFDGYAGVQGSVTADININGFITLPPPFPVKARLGVGALEGDRGITNDRLQIKANSVATFSNVSNTLNPATNFFNSTITNNDAQVPTRNPYGTNTMGVDLDLLNLPNPLNAVIPNNETGATLKLITSGDGYGAFLATFAVEIIEPEIKLVKRVNNIGGTDITGADVNLGQVLDYVLTFQNIGNDDAQGYTIRDILPVNTNFNSIDLSGAPGVTYTYNPVTREIKFTIPNNLVEVGDPAYRIRIRVQIVNSCNELTDACSNIIQNVAYSTYRGELNSNIITDDPSFFNYDESCGIGTQGPSNFLVDVDNCTFQRTEILCGASLQLTAGDGYASYEWHNGNGDIIGTTQSITVTAPGQYYVVNTPTPPCIGLTEHITVTLFGNNQTNPVLPFADEVVTCPNDGEQLPYIFLCGINDSRLLQTSIVNAQSIIWQKLNEASCPAIGVNGCANKNPICQWTQVGTGMNFNITTAGQYRLVINYQNGCFNRYYFNVYANLLDPHSIVENITCASPGSITVTNVPSGYEYQLVNQVNNTILVPYQANNVFPITTAGAYLVQIRQVGVTDGCVFELPNVGVQNLNLAVNLIPTHTSCNGLGSIRVQALNVGPQYYYSISGPSSANFGPGMDNNHVFSNLNPGTYTVTVTTDDGCTFTGTTTILNQTTSNLNAVVSQHISCNQGNIQMNSSGGQPPYNYAIYSYNGVLQNPTAGDFQTSVIFDIPLGQQGTYQFIMVDANNCSTISNPVTINLVPDVAYTTTVNNITCNGLTNGSISFALGNTQGYNVSFQLVNGSGTVIATNSSGNFSNLPAGNYTVNLTQTKGNRTCTFPIPFTITQPAPFLTGAATVTQAYTCVTLSGTVAVNPASVTGGTAPYQYSINGTTFGASSSFTGLTPGTYTITIKDAKGCTITTNPVTINALPQITNISFSATQPICPALTSNVTLTVAGGEAPFTYAITAPAGSAVNNGTNNVFNGLAAGTYTFTVTDANGCTYSKNFTIIPVLPIAVTGQPVSNVTCFGSANGSLTYTVSGFSTAYNYVVKNASNTTVASANNSTAGTVAVNSLPAGTYTITVTDTATNCTATAAVTIQSPSAALSLGTPVVTPITCTAQGSVSATATGGWNGYSYSLLLPNGTTIGPQASGTFSNLTLAGSYTLTVRDANNCVVTSNFSLTTPTPPVAGIAAASDLCFDSNGASIVISVTGGLAPYQYSINGSPNQTSNAFPNLSPGSYTVTVTDANNCTATVSRTISNQLTATATLVKNLDCTASPNAQITVAITGGTAPYTYQVSFNNGAFGAAQPVVGTTINYSVAAANAGTYQFKINAAGGCTVQTQTITIPQLTQPAITSVTQSQNILCNGESTGAINVVIDTTVGAAPYTLSVFNTTTGVNYGTQTSGLPAGTYEIRITDSNSCQSPVRTVSINQPAPITYNVASVDITCTGTGTSLGQIIVQNVAGGTPGYTYYVTSNFGFNETHAAPAGGDHSFTILNYGIYHVEVVDANGCSVLHNNIIIASPPEDLDINFAAVTTDCTTGGTAQVTVTASVLSGSYEFGILTTTTPPYLNPADYQPADPGTPETSTFTGLVPGVTYTFVVHDLVTNCYYFKQADQPISSPSGITATLNSINNVTCTGAADGNVSVTIAGYDAGATQINYQVYQAQSNTPTAVTGNVAVSGTSVTTNVGPLAPGMYYILFTEVGGADAGCSNSSPSFTIMQSTNLLQVSAVVTKNDNCNTNAGQITATGQFGTAPYQYQAVVAGGSPVSANWATANVFSLEGGNYDIYIKDAYGCVKFINKVLPTDAAPIIAASVVAQCTSAEGSFTINVVRTQNGIAPYTYSFNGGAFQPQASATFAYNNLSSGTYTIQVKDANGCGNTVNVEILAPLFATPAVAAEPSCANNDGEISVTSTGGSGNFTYELQNGASATIVPAQPTAGFTGLAAGNYIVVIHDADSGCTAQAPVTLAVPTPVTFTATGEDVSCNNGTDGTITITLPASNDNPPYTYAVSDGVNPAIMQSGPVFTGLPAGNYTVTVTSGKNCTDTKNVIIGEPSQLAISGAATAFVCDANNVPGTSTVTITVQNDATSNPSGTAPYTYSIDGTNYFTSNTFNVTDTGSTQNLTVYVKDANNCTATAPVVITPLPDITAVTATQVTAITCTNSETVQVSVTGGSGNYTFELLPQGSMPAVIPGAGIYTANFNLTAPGSYTFRVTDNTTGCYEATVPYEVFPFDTIDVVATAATPVTCFGGSNGSITINVTGYTGAYSYTVANTNGTVATGNGNTTTNPFTITNLPTGNFTVEITATGSPFCSADSNTITVPSPADALVLSAVAAASATCTNNQGEIVATATGGWGTYEYQLVNTTTSTTVQAYAANNSFAGLSAGNYTVSVRDAGGCIVTQNIVLTPAVPITANINASALQVACYGDTTATITATAVSGGEGVYQYILNTLDTDGTTILYSTDAQPDPQFPNLGAGIYSITVTDGWNCDATTATVTITEPTPVQGFLSLTDGLSCTTQAELTVSASGGTPPYQYSTDGVTYSATNVFAVGAGTYQYYVKDSNGCQAVLTNEVVIPAVPALDVNLDLTAAEIYCSGESTAMITSNATGGLGNYQYTLLNTANAIIVGPQADGTFAGLASGDYKIRAVSGDCEVVSNVINIAEPAPLTVTSIENDILCFGDANGSIIINASGGTGIIQYAITPNLDQFDTDNTFTGLAGGAYQVIVQDQNGCYQVLNFFIDEPAPLVATLGLIHDELCLNAADGSITIDITGGTGDYEVSLDNTTFTHVIGNQFTFTGLSGDTFYMIFVRDSNGCNINPPLQYYMNPPVEVIPTATVTPTCTNNVPGNIVEIGVNAAVVSDVQYSLDDVTYQPSNTFANLAPGNYTAYVKHTNGCTKSVTFIIDNLIPVTASSATTADVACFGGTTGVVTATATGGTGALQYAISPAYVYGSSNVFTGLAAGTYTVKVKDNIGCEVTLPAVTVNQPAAALTASVTGTHEICLNANDGTMTVTVSGGTAPYATSLDNVTFTTGQFSFTNLADGSYTIYVKDANGCTIANPLAFTVQPGVDIQPSATVTPNCTANVPGNVVTVSVNASVAGQVQYSLDGVTYQPSNTFSNVAVGAHTAYVKHSNGCIATAPFNVAPLQPITASSATTTDVACFGGTTGVVTATATGGTGALQYAISPAYVYGSSNVFAGLAAGTYTVKVKDNIGCEVTLPAVTVNQPAAALTASVTGTNEICLNANDGTMTVTVSGGTAPYATSLDNVTFTTGQFSFTNLADGNYTIYVKDANGCTIATPLAFTVQPGVDIQPSATVTPNCTANVPGNVVTVSVNVSVAGQVQYSVDGVTYQSANTFNGLATGNYTAYVKHNNGCIATTPFSVAPLQPITASSSTTADVACFGGTTGVVTATATGGTGALQYAISPAYVYGSSNVFTGLAAGTYTVKVKDNIGCEVTLPAVTVNQPAAALTASVTGTHEICLNANDGTMTVTVSGGTAPYATSLDNVTFTTGQFSFTNLADGNYTIYVKDANGCTIATPLTFTVQPGVDIQPSATVTPNCTANVPGNVVTVSVNVSVAGQVQYSLDGVTYQASNTFSNVAVGAHTAYVKHSNGCIATTSFNVAPLQPITASSATTTDVACFGGTTGVVTATATGGTGALQYAISPAYVYGSSNVFTGLAAGTYTVKVKDNIGCEVTLPAVTVNQPAAALTASVTGTHEICLNANDGTLTVTVSGGTAPYATSLDNVTFTTGQFSFTNLADGNYTIYVKDANGCTIATPLTFTVQPGVDIQPSATVTPNCTANVPGNVVAVSVNVSVAGQVQYSLDGVTYQASNTFSNVAVGAHTAYVKHNNGCIKTAPFNVAPLQPITASSATTTDVACFGGTTGVVTATATGGTGALQYAISPAYVYGSSNVFTGLAAGTYTVKVKDNIGCEVTLPAVTVNQPAAALTASVTGTNEICLNANDGTMTVTVSGGTAPYATSLDNVTFTTGQFNFTNLADGNYTIYVKDANGCTIATPLTFTVQPGVDIQPSATVTPNCTANVPGNVVTVSVNASVAGQVQYSLDGVTYQASNTFSNVAVGAHTAYVKHSNGCIATAPFNVAPLQPITASSATTADVACFGGTTGVVTATATGGTGALQYAISPAYVYGSSNVFTGLAAGTYTVKVKDNIGCEVTLPAVTVNQPAAAITATAVPTHEVCANDNNGAITITVSGGTAPYSTSINNSTFVQGQFVYSNLADGNYTVRVTDANGCIATQMNVTINSGVNIQPTATVTPNCTGNVPGNVVTVNVHPTVAGQVQYSLDALTYQAANIFNNLSNGSHTIYVKHNNGCVKTVSVNILNATPITASATITSNVLCFGSTTGAINVTASGGTGQKQYAISPDFAYQNSPNFTGLAAGNYVIRVRDNSGCELQLPPVTISQPAAALTATATATPEICFNQNNGSITVTVTGGTAPYSTRINNQPYQQGVLAYSNLADGTYTIRVRDANGCMVEAMTVVVAAGANIQPTATVTPGCNSNTPGSTVTINVNPAVAADVQYSADGVTYVPSNVFTDFTPGAHTVYVKHSNGCIRQVNFNVPTSKPIVATAAVTNNVACNGSATGRITATASGGSGTLLYGISPDYNMGTSPVFDNLAAGTYTIRVEDATGCFRLISNIAITEPAALVATEASVLQEICSDDNNGAIEIDITGGVAPYRTSLNANGPFVQNQFIFDNLDGGRTYTIYVKDANNCTSTIDVDLDAPINIDARIDPQYACAGNTLTVLVDPSVAADVTYALDGGTPQSSNVFTDLPNGPHSVEVVHTLGCNSTVTFNIQNTQPLQLTVTETALNTLTATATGGSGGYHYTFNGYDNGPGNVYVFYSSGNYLVTVTDSRGCTAQVSIPVRFVDIEVPDVVTPNNDGRNDTWGPGNTQNYPNITTDVFDRYGRKLAVLRQGQQWDGKYKGNELPTGDYWYIIRLGNPEDSREFVGHFTIYR